MGIDLEPVLRDFEAVPERLRLPARARFVP